MLVIIHIHNTSHREEVRIYKSISFLTFKVINYDKSLLVELKL